MAKYTNEEHTMIEWNGMFVPADERNRHYRQILEEGILIDDYIAPPPYVPTKEEQLVTNDKTFVRVLEDIINVLVSKGAISLTDLPQAAQDKLQERINIRNS